MSKKKRRDRGGDGVVQSGPVSSAEAVVADSGGSEPGMADPGVADAVMSEPGVAGDSDGAPDELFDEQPTRFAGAALAAEQDDAAAELEEEQPMRSGRALEFAAGDEAVAELSEDEPTRTAAGAALQAVRDPSEDAHRFEDHRFDFGTGEVGDLSEGDDVPPDPGSADSASPRLQSIVESLLFAADRPLNLRQLADLVEETEVERIRAAVLAVEQSWRGRGVQLHEVAGGYQFRTHPANAVWVQKLLQQKPVRLSRALLETLAIVSYRQPITRPEIDEIRGVDSGGTLKTLMDRALVRILGKKEEPGRPLLYGTTKEFLEFFSLRDLKDLPTLREYHELSEEHQAQVAALAGAAPEGSLVPDGELTEDEVTDALPKLSRLEIAPPSEDAAELAAIDRLIRTAGASIATDDDLPSAAEAGEADPDVAGPMDAGPMDAGFADAELGEAGEELLAVTGKFEAVGGRRIEPVSEFDDERVRTRTFGEPLSEAAANDELSADFESEESTRLRGEGLDAELVDGRDPNKEPAA